MIPLFEFLSFFLKKKKILSRNNAVKSNFVALMSRGSLFHLIKIGARLHPLESVLVYVLPFLAVRFLSEPLQNFFLFNAVMQTLLFVVVVLIPAYRTERMSYVDIGWPIGLVCIVCNAFWLGNGWMIRKTIFGSKKKKNN